MDVYTLRGTQLARRREASPALFENRKNCPDFRKKGSDCETQSGSDQTHSEFWHIQCIG